MVKRKNIKVIRIRSVLLFLALAIGAVIGTLLIHSAAPEARANTDAPGKIILSLQPFASGLSSPVSITNAGSSDDRLFVNERVGKIRIIQPDGTLLPTPFLDISGRVTSGGEQGFLGLAFHPDYASNGYFYVNYTRETGENQWITRISRFQVTADPNIADPGSEEILLTVDQPYSNHNAGDIHFGPDGYLYIPLGDGGSGGDPEDKAQDTGTLLGKITRIDVDSEPGSKPSDCSGNGTGSYKVPATNPFINTPGTCDEIWALGLRNPWRSSFDRLTGDFYIGDVGQNAWEEVDFQAAASTGGENYGWRCYEGNHPYNTSGCGPQSSYVFPIFEFSNPNDGRSVTGGYVYRGSQYPAMYGRYILADSYSGNFWVLVHSGNNWQATKHTNLSGYGYVAFGEDDDGELYVANLSSGGIYRLTATFIPLDYATYLPVVPGDG